MGISIVFGVSASKASSTHSHTQTPHICDTLLLLFHYWLFRASLQTYECFSVLDKCCFRMGTFEMSLKPPQVNNMKGQTSIQFSQFS